MKVNIFKAETNLMIALPFQATVSAGMHIAVNPKINQFFIIGDHQKLRMIGWKYMIEENELRIKGFKILGRDITEKEYDAFTPEPEVKKISEDKSMSSKRRKVRTK